MIMAPENRVLQFRWISRGFIQTSKSLLLPVLGTFAEYCFVVFSLKIKNNPPLYFHQLTPQSTFYAMYNVNAILSCIFFYLLNAFECDIIGMEKGFSKSRL